MTRVAVLSDIHANLHALRAVLDDVGDHGVDSFLIAGDLVGYGVDPNDCIALVRELPGTAVAGNHDLVAIGRASTERCGSLATLSLDWTRTRLSPLSLAYLESLPATASNGPFVITHGSLADPFEYVRSAEQARAQLARLAQEAPTARFLVLGHTHIAWAFGEVSGGDPIRARGARVRLRSGERYLLNPGSVGQSRDRRPDASYLMLDTETGAAEFRRVAYDVAACRDGLRRNGIPVESCHRRPPRGGRGRQALSRLKRRLVQPVT